MLNQMKKTLLKAFVAAVLLMFGTTAFAQGGGWERNPVAVAVNAASVTVEVASPAVAAFTCECIAAEETISEALPLLQSKFYAYFETRLCIIAKNDDE